MNIKSWFYKKALKLISEDYILIRRHSKCTECGGRKIRTVIEYTTHMRYNHDNGPKWYPIGIKHHPCYRCENCGAVCFTSEDCDVAWEAMMNVMAYQEGILSPSDTYPIARCYRPSDTKYDRFYPGQRVYCCKDATFKLGFQHKKGEIYTVTEDDVDYYNACCDDYQLVTEE